MNPGPLAQGKIKKCFAIALRGRAEGPAGIPGSSLWYLQVSYNKDLQIAPHAAKRLMLMARAPPEFIATAREAIGKVKTMAETGLKKEILESAETYPQRKFIKSAHNLFVPYCRTTDASSLMALNIGLSQKGGAKTWRQPNTSILVRR